MPSVMHQLTLNSQLFLLGWAKICPSLSVASLDKEIHLTIWSNQYFLYLFSYHCFSMEGDFAPRRYFTESGGISGWPSGLGEEVLPALSSDKPRMLLNIRNGQGSPATKNDPAERSVVPGLRNLALGCTFCAFSSLVPLYTVLGTLIPFCFYGMLSSKLGVGISNIIRNYRWAQILALLLTGCVSLGE